VTVVHASRQESPADLTDSEGVRFVRLDRPQAAVNVVMSASEPIVHLHGVWDPIVRSVASGCARQGVPAVISSHGMLHPCALRKSWFKKRAYLALFPTVLRWPAELLCLNSEEAGWAKDNLGAHATVATPGIEPSDFDVDPHTLPTQSPWINAGEQMALFVGRLEPIKGVDRLIDAFRMARHSARLRLVIAGPDQGELSSLIRQCKRSGLADRVHFLGFVHPPQRLRLLREASLYVHRPRYEGFGIAVVEAMAARLPVLTTAACKLPGAAEGGALRCVADDSRTFSEQLDLLMDDEAERRALGLRGRSWVEANLSWDSVLRVHDGAYRRAANRRR
jgi:glycosyltransferase involved in cell wall biosynthesis